jgi:hypothetical protein
MMDGEWLLAELRKLAAQVADRPDIGRIELRNSHFRLDGEGAKALLAQAAAEHGSVYPINREDGSMMGIVIVRL